MFKIEKSPATPEHLHVLSNRVSEIQQSLVLIDSVVANLDNIGNKHLEVSDLVKPTMMDSRLTQLDRIRQEIQDANAA